MLGSTLATLWFILLILPVPQSAKRSDVDSDEKVYDLGPGITRPRVTKQVTPHYSESRGVKVEGSVTIELIVSSQGLPRNARVIKGIEREVDQSALDAVAQWRFDPARKDDKPVAVRIQLEIDFHSM